MDKKIVALVGLSGCFVSRVLGGPLTIMPVGDSITVGYTDNPTWSVPYEDGYRYDLYNDLTTKGYQINYVGNSPEPYNQLPPPHKSPSPDLRTIGQDNFEAYSGEGTGFIAQNIGAWVTAYQPNVILLDIGINDTIPGSPDVYNNAEANYQAILTAIYAADPRTMTLVGEVTPYSEYTGGIVALNSYLTGTLVPEFAAAGDNVSTVDLYDPLLALDGFDSSNFSNGINHPDAYEYDNMATTYANALEAVVPATVPEPAGAGLLAATLLLGASHRRKDKRLPRRDIHRQSVDVTLSAFDRI